MPAKILMVCLGNICRSPLAEGVLRAKLSHQNFEIDSAGTGNWHVGHPPDKRSVAVAQKYNIDISHLKGRQIQPADFEAFDYIYVMDLNNLSDVKALAKNEQQAQKVTLILDELFPGENLEVPDPYYGTERDFEHTYDLLNQACEVIAQKLQKT